ncbi:Competence/damage-inducible protein CinA C-terminal domain [Neisseria gonorrhoeae]|nr:Competence/damage-inducible protein CinA C-terminal domain [Neisseria gonorrhoeae]
MPNPARAECLPPHSQALQAVRNGSNQSFVTYSNKAKEYRLGVLPETLLEHGAVSRQTVYEMARGAKAVAQADYAVGISGIAGPGGGESKPVGTVWFGVCLSGRKLRSNAPF